mmetsp:Transcript_76043/g.152781  ORF Transcript_76043/g.152781 Transcript_76043/m.152781 type:complete len:317 (+) Transcript_76043:1191-2141(+)
MLPVHVPPHHDSAVHGSVKPVRGSRQPCLGGPHRLPRPCPHAGHEKRFRARSRRHQVAQAARVHGLPNQVSSAAHSNAAEDGGGCHVGAVRGCGLEGRLRGQRQPAARHVHVLVLSVPRRRCCWRRCWRRNGGDDFADGVALVVEQAVDLVRQLVFREGHPHRHLHQHHLGLPAAAAVQLEKVAWLGPACNCASPVAVATFPAGVCRRCVCCGQHRRLLPPSVGRLQLRGHCGGALARGDVDSEGSPPEVHPVEGLKRACQALRVGELHVPKPAAPPREAIDHDPHANDARARQPALNELLNVTLSSVVVEVSQIS